MFKFDFDIDDAEYTDGLEYLGITPPNSKNTTRHGSDPSQEVLEPSSEISLTQLVRATMSSTKEYRNPDSCIFPIQ